MDMFPQMKTAVVEKQNSRYALAIQMYRMRNPAFHRVVLTTLDISPLAVAMLSMQAEVFLYNKWHQWWLLQHETVDGYLKAIPRISYNIFVFVYLLISVGFIFSKRSFNIFATVFFRRKTDKRYGY
jgi:hypothetical protein